MVYRTASLAAICGLAALQTANAEMLDQAACDSLKAEQAQFVASGVKAEMGRGAEWGKANLAAERLAQIKRSIEVDEQVAFRCPQPAPPPEKPAQAAGKKGKAKAKAATVTPDLTLPDLLPETAGAPVTAPPETAKAKPKTKKQPVDDAFVPPSGQNAGIKIEAKPQ